MNEGVFFLFYELSSLLMKGGAFIFVSTHRFLKSCSDLSLTRLEVFFFFFFYKITACMALKIRRKSQIFVWRFEFYDTESISEYFFSQFFLSLLF